MSNDELLLQNVLITNNDNTKNCYVNKYLYTYLNNLNTCDDAIVQQHIQTYCFIHGLIYNIQQIENLLGKSVNISVLDGKIYIDNIEIKEFIEKNIYSMSFIDHIQNITLIENHIDKSFISAFCCFFGNEIIMMNIMDVIIKRKKTNHTFIFIVKSKQYLTYINSILKHFKSYVIFHSKEYGNDIIPSLQSLYHILNHEKQIQYIYKIHTKSDIKWLSACLNTLLDTPFDTLCEDLNENILLNNCNCISYAHFYSNIQRDVFNKRLIKMNEDKIDKLFFVRGTIFFTHIKLFETILKFLQQDKYFRSYFLNNIYDDNTTMYDCSPVHFLERLFGIIQLEL